MDAPIIVTGLAGMLAIIVKFWDFMKMLTNLRTEKSGVITQGFVWFSAIGVTFLFSATQFGNTVEFGGITLDQTDTPTKFWIGLAIGSLGSLVVDFKQALDGSDSAKKPPLVPPGA